MGATQDRAQTLISMKAAATLSAYRVVKLSSANTVNYYDTTTSLIFGVTQDDSGVGGSLAVKVAIAGTAKVTCGASVSAGAVVCPQAGTNTGVITEAAHSFSFTSAALIVKTLGIAMQSGSTNSVIEVLLMPNNISKIA